MKKFKRSPITIVCYVLAGIAAVYMVYLAGTSITTVNNYYGQYGVTPGFGEVFGYVLQSAMNPLLSAVTFLVLGVILDEVRKLNPDNYMEIEAAAEKEADGDDVVIVEDEESCEADQDEAAAEAENNAEQSDEMIGDAEAVSEAEEAAGNADAEAERTEA